MSSSSPPAYLLPDFDPSKAKVAELRGILLAHNIPYTSNAKKSELVNLFKTRIVPLIPQLLADISAVRASDDGVLDGNSHDGSLRELDTDYEQPVQPEDSQDSTASRKDAKKKKSKRKSMVGRAHEAAAAAEEQESEQEAIASPRKKKSSRKNEIREPSVEHQCPAEYDEVVPLAGEPAPSSTTSPKKRKASAHLSGDEGTPRTSSILKVRRSITHSPLFSHIDCVHRRFLEQSRRKTIQSEGEGGFSDYNPFQSGGEETPGRETKKRKSSLGPERLKSRKSTTFDLDEPELDYPDVAPPPVPSTSSASLGVSSPVKPPQASSSRPDLTTANSWSSSTPEEARQRLLNPDGARKSSSSSASTSNRRATMGPSTSASRLLEEEKKSKSSRASLGGGSTPIGVKFMAPMDKVKTTPPEAQKLLKEFEETQKKERLRKQEEAERKRKQEELERAEAEVRRLELERERQRMEQEPEEGEEVEEMEIDDLEYDQGEPEVDPLMEDDQDLIIEEDEFIDERDPFEAGNPDEEEEEYEEELFAESAPAPPPVVQTLRGEQISTPRRSEPLPYSPRQAQLKAQQQAIANTPRRSFPLPTPPTSSSKRQVALANSRPSKQQQNAIALRSTSSALSRDTAQTVKRVSSWTILLLTIVYSLWWREEKLAVGFCDTNSSSNQLVSQRSTSLAVPSLPPSLCTTLDALNLRPTCTPCPTHGFCQSGKFVGCSIDYVPKASALRLGGLLPIAPKCVPDTEKLMVVAMQASKASRLLRKRRGEVVCGGLERLRKKQNTAGKDGLGDKEAFVYGLQADNVLSALMRENEASKSPFSEEVIEELNRLALNDLVNHGEVLTWQDGDDYWYASKTAEMPLSCQARLAAIRSAKKHKTGLAGVLSALMSMLWLRYKLQARVQEKQRVAELVQTALVQLQRQERSHHTDPVLVPFPHIAPSHLRDLVLQHVHSPTRRAQLWKKVEKVVEGNSNVRVMEVEQNGEELRGWQWVGATGAREIEASSSTASSPEKKERPEMFQSGRSVLNAAAR
ncbi:uncharacterized protein JCM6883_001128 [Sporobolomyces salmoneus]|uniref:uncharacterized protein n=1 Tax=Sporobolomyces salmoneus TaxID=183962 RepID=UPI00316F7A06